MGIIECVPLMRDEPTSGIPKISTLCNVGGGEQGKAIGPRPGLVSRQRHVWGMASSDWFLNVPPKPCTGGFFLLLFFFNTIVERGTLQSHAGVNCWIPRTACHQVCVRVCVGVAFGNPSPNIAFVDQIVHEPTPTSIRTRSKTPNAVPRHQYQTLGGVSFCRAGRSAP